MISRHVGIESILARAELLTVFTIEPCAQVLGLDMGPEVGFLRCLMSTDSAPPQC